MTDVQAKKFKWLFVLSVLWWVVYAVFSFDEGFNVSYTKCHGGVCTITEKTWFGFGKEKNKIVFAQNKVGGITMRKNNGKIPHYYFFLNKESVSKCVNPFPLYCENANNIGLPVDFYRLSSAENYIEQISFMSDFEEKDMGVLFNNIAAIWLLSVLFAGLMIVLKI